MSRAAGDEKFGWRRAGDVPAPSRDDIEQMLTPWLNGRRVQDVDLLSGGLMNRNCRVRVLGMASPVVLRLYDRDVEAAAKEVAVLGMLRGSLPVPEVLYARLDPREANPPFAVLEFVDGMSLGELKRSGDPTAIAEAAYEAGRLLAHLQTHRFSRTGLLTAALTLDPTRLPDPVTTTTLVEWFSRSAAFRSRTGERLAGAVLRAANDWDEHPGAPAMPATLVHGDFNSRNLLVRQVSGKWSVTAILDWEFAFAGPMSCDIGNFLRYERQGRPRFEPSFSRGLRDGGVQLDGDWFQAARMADLPALCELLTRASTPDDVVAEVLDLVRATVD